MQRCAQFGTSVFAILCLACLTSQAFAQAVDSEPNNSCFEAQDVGALDGDIPFIVTGSLDTPPEEPDVDFFRFEALPGAVLVADLEGAITDQDTLPDPFLGLFDSDCNLVDVNDDAGSFASRLVFIAPADGIVILAASGCCDSDFTGVGGSSGSYTLSIDAAPPPIGSIVGRVIDETTEEPLPGTSPPFALVDLLRCDGGDCFEFVAELPTDEDGRFRFERDFFDQPIPPGTYQVAALASEFEQSASEPFEVAEGEDFDVGDLALAPAPIAFLDIQPCEDLPPQGDSCRYSVTLRNNTDAPLHGLAWSLVDGSNIPSSLAFTRFEASAVRGSRQALRVPVTIDASAEQVLQFRFDVPAFALGATFCTEIFVGASPEPLVTTIRQASLFCITGTDTGFELVGERESRKISKALSGRPGLLATPALAKPRKQPAR